MLKLTFFLIWKSHSLIVKLSDLSIKINKNQQQSKITQLPLTPSSSWVIDPAGPQIDHANSAFASVISISST